ncbi:MAG: exosortase system-associated protein, TIGR04073 family [Victivallales bacterium]|jgi:putative exosortase-associated protein (TIGR04073 family)
MRKIFAVILTASVFFICCDSRADGQNPVKKLARGIVNAAIGIGEIPINIADIEEKEGPLSAATYGTLKGVCFFVLREVVGVVEVATFYAPLPGTLERESAERDWGYGPIMEPEWVVK